MSSEEREKTILANIKLVYSVIDRLNLRKNFEEYVDLGIIGLCHGVDNFDSTKGYALSTYLYICIRNEILMYLRKKRPITISIEVEIEDGIFGYDVIKDDINIEEDYGEKEKSEIMYEKIQLLEPEEQFIINRLFGLNGTKQLTQFELGKILNTSQAQISKRKCEIIEKLKKIIKGEYYE